MFRGGKNADAVDNDGDDGAGKDDGGQDDSGGDEGGSDGVGESGGSAVSSDGDKSCVFEELPNKWNVSIQWMYFSAL